MDVQSRIEKTKLIPVAVLDDVPLARDTAEALLAGGVDVMEITLRTDAGLPAIASVAASVPNMLVGAGTVLSVGDCREAVRRGAQFIVSPGFDAEIVSWCLSQGICVFPGCVTPTEIASAARMGLSVLKFFPANVFGGASAIAALRGPFPHIRFIPTGGVDLSNLKEYANADVFAVGGAWLCPRASVKAGRFDEITEACLKSRRAIDANAADDTDA
jgi:2-dehydro-3-deoxyphosphogluconate aldolase/(4S)-4-hydroxy-2-oxoglutarate aldolase